jgi:hypothetical protein
MKGNDWETSDKTCDPTFGGDIEIPTDCIRKYQPTLKKYEQTFYGDQKFPFIRNVSFNGKDNQDMMIDFDNRSGERLKIMIINCDVNLTKPLFGNFVAVGYN